MSYRAVQRREWPANFDNFRALGGSAAFGLG